jgi:hypothetical protein
VSSTNYFSYIYLFQNPTSVVHWMCGKTRQDMIMNDMSERERERERERVVARKDLEYDIYDRTLWRCLIKVVATLLSGIKLDCCCCFNYA